MKRIRKLLLQILIKGKLRKKRRGTFPVAYSHSIHLLLQIYKDLRYHDNIPQSHGRHSHIARTIESFDEMDCWMKFRTRKEDLPRLLRAFRFDRNDAFVADNKTKFTGEEIMLIGLHRYVIPGPLEATMARTFNLDFSQLSRAIKIFNNHIIKNLSYLLTDNLQYWMQHFSIFSEKIRLKVSEKGDIHYPEGNMKILLFIMYADVYIINLIHF